MEIEKIEQWTRRAILHVRKGSESVKIVLRHFASGSKNQSDVDSWEVEDSATGDDGTVTNIVNGIVLASESDVTGIGGVQSYCLQSYHGDAKAHSSRMTFRVDGTDSENDDSTVSGPITKEVIITHFMRHNEALMRSCLMGAHQTGNVMARALERLSQQVETLERTRMETRQALESALSEQEDRALSRMKEEARAKMIERVGEKVVKLLPVVASNLGKKPGNGHTKEGKDALIEALKDSLMKQPEKMAKLAGILSPEDQAIVLQLLSGGQSI